MAMWDWLFGKDCKGDPRGNIREITIGRKKDHELYGTYIVIDSNVTSGQMIAMQQWAQNHPALEYVRMPYASIMAKANANGRAYIAIDENGRVFDAKGPHLSWRKLEMVFCDEVSYYKVSSKTIKVGDNHYDVNELKAAIKHLEPREV